MINTYKFLIIIPNIRSHNPKPQKCRNSLRFPCRSFLDHFWKFLNNNVFPIGSKSKKSSFDDFCTFWRSLPSDKCVLLCQYQNERNCIHIPRIFLGDTERCYFPVFLLLFCMNEMMKSSKAV